MASVDQAPADPSPAINVVAPRPAVFPRAPLVDPSASPADPSLTLVGKCRLLVWRLQLPALLTSAMVHALAIAALGLWSLSNHDFDAPPELLVETLRPRVEAAPLLVEQETEGQGGLTSNQQSQGSGGNMAVHLPPRENPAIEDGDVVLRFDAPPSLVLGSMMTLPDVNLNLALTEPRRPIVKAEPKPAPEKPAMVGLPGLQPGLGMFGGRHPAAKSILIKKLGGNDDSEAAVKRALAWIKLHQEPDGHWSLHAFPQHPKCDNKCTHPGVYSDTAGTAMALLPFLGAGYTHTEGEHAECIGKGINWLIAHQVADGGWADSKITRIYAHAQATIVLAEAYAMTRDARLLLPIERAIALITNWQDEEGGWRYEPGTPGDVSVSGWQVMAVHSVEGAGIPVTPQINEMAMGFLDSHQVDGERGLYRYMMNKTPITETMTAEGLLMREYGGWPYEAQPLQYGVMYLLNNAMPIRDKPNIYYWYYATQVFHHIGGPQWQKWNGKMRDLLIDLQIKDGHMSGSWTPKEQHDMAGGRLYMTSLATLSLEVYYRHMPIYYDGMNPEKKLAARP